MATDKKKTAELMKTDLYGLFELTSDSSEKDIRSAYRKTALKCHPDKNPDNPKAADLFQKLTDALEILTDPVARGTYDKLLKAREHAAIRHRELDAKRRKLKEDLEARERNAAERRYSEAELEKQLQREVARLREEGSRIIAEESRKLREDLAESVATAQEKALEESLRVKIRWNRKLGSYSEEDLERFLKRHGRISSLIVSSKKPGNAMVEFEEAKAAQSAVKYVKGLPGNPLSLSLVNQHGGLATQECSVSSSPSSQQTFSFPPAASRSVQEDSDFEKMVLAKMRARGKEQKAEDALAREAQSVE